MDKNNNTDNFFNINLNDLNGFDAPPATPTIDYQRYWNHLLKHKWWILLITLVVTGAFYIVYNIYYEKDYSSTAVVQFNRTSRQNPVDDFDNTKPEGRVELLKTKDLLGKVVDSLRLNIKLRAPKKSRFKVIPQIDIFPTAQRGKYKITKTDEKFLFYVEKDTLNEDWQLLHTGVLNPDGKTSFSAAGFNLTFINAILEKAPEIVFSYTSRKGAISKIRGNLDPRLDRSKTILYISYEDKDPYVSQIVTNTIANLFIQKLEDFSRMRSSSMLITLQHQLRKAQEEMAISERELSRFRVSNPNVLADRRGKQSLKELVDIESDLYKINQKLDYIDGLLQKKESADNAEDRNFVYQEIISLLEEQEVPGAKLFNIQYYDLLNERQDLLDKMLPPQNLEVVKVSEQIAFLQQQIDKLIARYTDDVNRFKNKIASELSAEKRNLGSLPSAELNYAELKMDHEVKSKIVEDILEKYNEAKLANAVSFTDALVIDEADLPRGGFGFKDHLKAVTGGLLLGLFCSVSLFLFIGYFDKSIKSVKDIKDNLNLPVLVTVPWIDKEKSKAEVDSSINGNGNGQFDVNLVTKDYAPTLENEVFRRLRVKLSPSDDQQQLTIPVTSMNPNEGKSFVSSNLAITFSQQKRLTLLIDGDIRRGVLHSSFGCKKNPGLTDFLLSNCTVDAENIAKIIQKTYIPNLFMITVGKPVPNPLEILSSPRMEALYHFLKDNFSTIIIDSPPFGLVPDVFVLKRFINEVLLVTRFEKTNMNHLKEGLNDFVENDMKIKGVILNASETEHRKYGKYYKYSYYNY